MKTKTIQFIKKPLLIIGVLLSLACLAHGQYQPPPQQGDYRTKENRAKVTDTGNKWEVYNGTSWEDATVALADFDPPFSKNIYAKNNMIVDADFTMNGNIYSPTAASVFSVQNGAIFTLGSNSTYELRQMFVCVSSRFINLGNIISKETNSKVTLDPGPSLGEGGILENHGQIEIENELHVNNYAKVISKDGAKIHGPGKIITNPAGVGIEIANQEGYNEAIQLTGANSTPNVCFTFNGGPGQVTGDTLPDPVYKLEVDSGHTLTLSKPVSVIGNTEPALGAPNVTVKSGSTLDLGAHSITAASDWGTSEFNLESGATIVTAHPDGISSFKGQWGGGYVQVGAIRTNNVTYSSGATYHFNGAAGQKSGDFVPTTTVPHNTVYRIFMDTPGGLQLSSAFQPLVVTDGYTGTYIDNRPTYGWIEGQPLTLPVTLSYFNAFFNGFDSVILQWETQSETNNLGFYVLRSIEADAAQANVVSALVPAANSSQGASYYYEDADFYIDGLYYYWLQDVSFSGATELHGPITVQVTLGSGSNHVPDPPLTTSLVRNYPNPFNPSTQLEYYLEEGSDVSFEVYNIKGQMVDQITLRYQDKGFHRLTWEPQLGSGIYLIKFTADGKSNIRKVALTK